MFTVNLEDKLVKENKILIKKSDVLAIRTYDTLAENTTKDELNILEQVGLNPTYIDKATNLKKHLVQSELDIQKFNKDRVFHISQIEKIARKYRLRFLRTGFFNGTIDPEVPFKINQFQLAYSVECNRRNMYILAPKNSFKLQERPKDPLMFYQINEEYYYLIHKWGNDLSIFRRAYGVLAMFFADMTFKTVFTLLAGLILLLYKVTPMTDGCLMLILSLYSVSGIAISYGVNNLDYSSFFIKDKIHPNWSSPFRD